MIDVKCKQTVLTPYPRSIFGLLVFKSHFSKQRECGCLLDIYVCLSLTCSFQRDSQPITGHTHHFQVTHDEKQD